MSDYFRKSTKNVIDQIKYRGTIVTGEITVDNGDGTYDVKIANAKVAFPNVETVLYGETFSVGEIVMIGNEYGSKEAPKIIGHAKKIAQNPVQVEVDYGEYIIVITLDAYSITTVSAYVEGKINLSEGMGNCTRRGFKYGLTTAYGSDIHEDGSYGVGYFNKQITELTADTIYHFQAYVLDTNGDEQIGEDKSFTTNKRLIAVIVRQHNNDDYLKFYDLDGILQNSYLLGNGIVYFGTDCMAMDAYNNVYYIKNSNYLTKVDSNGNELLSVAIAGYPESIAMGADGYLYTREQNGKIHKRDASDFSSQSYITLTAGKSYYGLILDKFGSAYIVNYTDNRIEKWRSNGTRQYYRTIANSGSSSLGLADNNYIARTSSIGTGYSYKIHKSLSSNETIFSLTNIDYQHGCGSLSDKYLFVGENNASANLYLEKFNISDLLDWSIAADTSQNSPDNSLVAAYPF